MKIRIRQAEPEDHDEIAAMDLRCFVAGEHRPDFSDNVQWWIAETEDGVPVAYAAARRSYQWMDSIYLLRAGVLPEVRGMGLQRRLIRVREAWGRQRSAIWSITDTAYDNPRSSNTLIRCGYRMFVPSKKWCFGSATYWRRKIAEDA